jgi:hypothetical protein
LLVISLASMSIAFLMTRVSQLPSCMMMWDAICVADENVERETMQTMTHMAIYSDHVNDCAGGSGRTTGGGGPFSGQTM